MSNDDPAPPHVNKVKMEPIVIDLTISDLEDKTTPFTMTCKCACSSHSSSSPSLSLPLLGIVLAMMMSQLGHLTFTLLISYVVSRNVKQHIVTKQVWKKLSLSASKFHSKVQLSTTTVAGRMHLKPVAMKPYMEVILLLDPGKLSLSTAITMSSRGRERR